MTDPLGIDAHALTRRYGEGPNAHLAVDDVSFSIATGEVFGLLGPNGAGKTTILRMLAGILTPSAGSASLMGVDVSADPIAAKRNLGFLSGDTALYARLTGRETLRYFARLAGLDDATTDTRITEVIDDFGLQAFVDQRTGALSSGQNQRVNLARAFIADPPVLILDEPTVGLDVISGRFVIEAIEAARSRGKAVLFSTHIMSEVDELCDRIGLLLSGQLRAVGTRDELLEAHDARHLGQLLIQLHEASP